MLSRLDFPAPSGRNIHLLMLPPAGAKAADFAAEGLVEDAQARGDIEITAIEPDLELYLDGGIAGAVHAVLEPARARGRRIWLLGISLGGMGALLYAAAQPRAVEGIILLAPFLGTRGTLAALEKPGIAGAIPEGATVQEATLLAWLQDHLVSAGAPALYLGYGTEDRFGAGHRLLARALPPEQVAALPGGHDWACWRALWQVLLAASELGGRG